MEGLGALPRRAVRPHEPQPLYSPDTPMMDAGEPAEAPPAEATPPSPAEAAGETVEEGGEVNLEDEISFDDAFEDDDLMTGTAEGKAVEELDLDQFEGSGETGPSAAAAPAGEETRSEGPASPEEGGPSLLAAKVEELTREVEVLREENRAVRRTVEGILAGIGRQIEVLEGMKSGGEDRAGEEESGPSGSLPPEKDR